MSNYPEGAEDDPMAPWNETPDDWEEDNGNDNLNED